jgi:hypothetical protein
VHMGYTLKWGQNEVSEDEQMRAKVTKAGATQIDPPTEVRFKYIP